MRRVKDENDRDFVERITEPVLRLYKIYFDAWTHKYWKYGMIFMHLLVLDCLFFIFIMAPGRNVKNKHTENMVNLCDIILDAVARNPVGAPVFSDSCLEFESDYSMGTYTFLLAEWVQIRFELLLAPFRWIIMTLFSSLQGVGFSVVAMAVAGRVFGIPFLMNSYGQNAGMVV